MLNFLYDFFPVLAFFVAFKFYDIYVATTVGIVVTALQVVITGLWQRRIDKKQLLTLVIFTLFGGMTLYFHNPIFVKWKPTIIFWIFGLVFLGSQFIGKKPLIQRMFTSVLEGKNNSIPVKVWKKLNIAWTIFFIIMGGINIVVAYYFSTNAWVNFKLYGTMGLLFLFSFGQSIYLAKYMPDAK